MQLRVRHHVWLWSLYSQRDRSNAGQRWRVCWQEWKHQLIELWTLVALRTLTDHNVTDHYGCYSWSSNPIRLITANGKSASMKQGKRSWMQLPHHTWCKVRPLFYQWAPCVISGIKVCWRRFRLHMEGIEEREALFDCPRWYWKSETMFHAYVQSRIIPVYRLPPVPVSLNPHRQEQR